MKLPGSVAVSFRRRHLGVGALLFAACSSDPMVSATRTPDGLDDNPAEPDPITAPVQQEDAGLPILAPEPATPTVTIIPNDPDPEPTPPVGCTDCGAQPQEPEPTCGDGLLNVAGESCDDANVVSGDGCSPTCELEANYACPTPGQSCVSTMECGDSKLSGSETCDDGNVEAGDGCDQDCSVEPGWACSTAGVRCAAAACGDGIVVGDEECDVESEGCSDCEIVDGYDCDAVDCHTTVCGDGQIERGEQCEDGNDRPFDGCYECKFEVTCENGSCMSVCGDGQRYADEACDDGNARDGDGCSATCEVENGYSCEDIAGVPPPSVELPVIYRDFIGKGHRLDTSACYDPRSESATADKPEPCYHINFNELNGTSLQGVVEPLLGPSGTPELLCGEADCSDNPGLATNNFTSTEDFNWYDDDNPQAISVFKTLTLSQTTETTYAFAPTSGFYPIDDAGWTLLGEEWLRPGPQTSRCSGGDHNYAFSTETRFFFEYTGGERFEFNGDDDLWVFVNGKLAIDLSGLHGARWGWFEIDADDDGADSADSADGMVTFDNAVQGNPQTADFGLVVGGVYEVALFHAERNYCGSNFELTLKDFNRPKSTCGSTCGDGVVATDELCDDGPSGNDGSYGSCGSDCLSRGGYCGDGIAQLEQEQCDDGVNLTTYGSGCAPGCVAAPTCGDGIIQSDVEQCDDGVNDGGYGECAAGCVLDSFCGDGVVDEAFGESCDDANRANKDGCDVNCRVEVNLVF